MQELLEQIANDPAGSMLTGFLAAGLIIEVIGALLNCFLGYFLYRIGLMICGAVMLAGPINFSGPLLGWPMIATVPLSILLAAVGAYVFYRFYRVITTAFWAIGIGAIFVLLTSIGFEESAPLSSLPLGVNIVFGVLLAAGIAVLVYVFVRHVIILSSALQGGLTIAVLTGIMVVLPSGGSVPGWNMMITGWTLAGLLGLAFAVLGAVVQYRLTAKYYRREPEKPKSKSVVNRPPTRKRRAA